MKKISITIYLALLQAAVVLIAPTSAWAQVPYTLSYGYYGNTFTQPSLNHHNDAYYEDLAKSAREKNKKRSLAASEKPAGRASTNNNPLPYSRDRALSLKIREEFLADFTKRMPKKAATEMQAVLEQVDVVQMMAGFVQLQGMDSGTVDGLIAFGYGQAWAITHQKPMPTPKQYQGIADQLRVRMGKSSDWSTMSNERRQMFFERLAYPLFIQKANYQTYLEQGRSEHMARMAEAAQESLKKAGVDLRNLRLSDNGFVGL